MYQGQNSVSTLQDPSSLWTLCESYQEGSTLLRNSANLCDLSARLRHDWRTVLLCSQFSGKLLLTSCKLVHSWYLLFPLQEVWSCKEVLPESHYSRQILPFCMDRNGTFFRSARWVWSGHVDIQDHYEIVPRMCSSPSLHGYGILENQQLKDCYIITSKGKGDQSQWSSDLLITRSDQLQAKELQRGKEIPWDGIGEVPPWQFILGARDDPYKLGPRMPKVKRVQACSEQPVAMCKSKLIKPSNLLLARFHLPLIRTVEQGNKFLPQIPEVQTRQPVRSVDVTESDNRCELIILG